MSIQTDGTADCFANNTGTPPVTGDPVTIAVWFQRSADTAGVLVALGQSASLLNSIVLYVAADGTIQARKYDGVSNTTATSTTGTDDTATWHHACGVFVSDTVRHAYFDGGSKGTSATTTRTASAYSATRIGGALDGSLRFNGLTAHVAIWNIALSDAQVALLAGGDNPLTVENANLVAYYTTLESGDAGNDSIGTYDLTFGDTAGYSATNPTVDDPPAAGHPAQSRTRGIPGMNSIASRFGRGW